MVILLPLRFKWLKYSSSSKLDGPAQTTNIPWQIAELGSSRNSHPLTVTLSSLASPCSPEMPPARLQDPTQEFQMGLLAPDAGEGNAEEGGGCPPFSGQPRLFSGWGWGGHGKMVCLPAPGASQSKQRWGSPGCYGTFLCSKQRSPAMLTSHYVPKRGIVTTVNAVMIQDHYGETHGDQWAGAEWSFNSQSNQPFRTSL